MDLLTEQYEGTRRFADRLIKEQETKQALAFTVVSEQVVTSILTHCDREQAETLLDVLNDSGEMTISTACMVSAQLLAHIIRRVDPAVAPQYVAGVTRLALQISEEDRQLAELADAVPAGAA